MCLSFTHMIHFHSHKEYTIIMTMLLIFLIPYIYLGLVNADTLCPDTWIADRGSCYLFALNQASTFMDAENFCSSHDSTLVVVDDSIENEFLKLYLRNFKSTPWWIGLSDSSIEGDWRWFSTGEVPKFVDWAPNEPNSYNGQHDEDCGVMHSSTNFKWVDDLCSLKYPPICERKVDETSVVIG